MSGGTPAFTLAVQLWSSQRGLPLWSHFTWINIVRARPEVVAGLLPLR